MVSSDSENSDLDNLITKIEGTRLKESDLINLKMDTIKPEEVEFNPNITELPTQAETSRTSFNKPTRAYAGIDSTLKTRDNHTHVGSMKSEAII